MVPLPPTTMMGSDPGHVIHIHVPSASEPLKLNIYLILPGNLINLVPVI